MTDKEKIRAEIERLEEIHERQFGKPMERGRIGHAHGYVDCCDQLLSFIDSLPEEPAPKESDDLEEAADEYALNVNAGPYNSIAKYGFMAGAIWQGAKMMDGWLKDRDGCFWDGVEEGKQAMEKQMMEGAVEGEITKDIHNLLHVKSDVLPMSSEFKFGDKVKIIILRNDDHN
jgi:hypothetical protein